MPYYTYILKSLKNNRYYIGSTEDIDRRLQDHNWSRTKSTKSGIPWVVVYTEIYETRREAVKREYQIKAKKSRKYIEYLLKSSSG
jgi:putative endonuclease